MDGGPAAKEKNKTCSGRAREEGGMGKHLILLLKCLLPP